MPAMRGSSFTVFHCLLTLTGFAFSPAWPATEVCGELKLTQEWTEKESPYLITGDIYVPPTAMLRIGPGVDVRFVRTPKPCSGADSIKKTHHSDPSLIAIKVEGGFYCLGEPGRPVTFAPKTPGKSVGWEGLQFTGQVMGQAEISFAEFRGANRAIWAEKALFTVHHVLFENNNAGIWLGPRADVAVLNSNFIRNRSAGLRVDRASPRIVNNLFYANRAYGIWIGEGGGFNISYNAFFQNGEEDCFHCPYAVLQPTTKNIRGDTCDAFFNLRVDPIFEGSENHKAALAADPGEDTPAHKIKDQKLAELEKKSRKKFWKGSAQHPGAYKTRGTGPYVLSRYSKLLHAGHPAKALRNPDGTAADIGMFGGPNVRITKDPL